MTTPIAVLSEDGVRRFVSLREAAVSAVVERLVREHPLPGANHGEAGSQLWGEDLALAIEFLRAAQHSGVLQPFREFLVWLRHLLPGRGVPDEHLRFALDYLEEFYAPHLTAADRAALAATLASGWQDPTDSVSPLEAIDGRMPSAWDDHRALAAALLTGNRKAATALARRYMDQGASLLDIELHLVQPALYQVGREWFENRITVAQEHLATSTATVLLAQLASALEPMASLDSRILVSCVEGNHHAVGPRMVADAFEQRGWEVRFLGADVPTGALVDEVRRWQPSVLALSLSMPGQVATCRGVIGAVSNLDTPTPPAVLLGGLAINSLPWLAGVLGAQGEAPDARSALEAAEGIVAVHG